MAEQGTECNSQSPTYLEWEALSQVILFVTYITFNCLVIHIQSEFLFSVVICALKTPFSDWEIIYVKTEIW